LRALAADEHNDADALVKILWVLRHQNEDRIFDVAAKPPAPEELAAVARGVDVASLPDYVAALDAMLDILIKKKPPPPGGGPTTTKPSA
jgi:hypothetical protein